MICLLIYQKKKKSKKIERLEDFWKTKSWELRQKALIWTLGMTSGLLRKLIHGSKLEKHLKGAFLANRFSLLLELALGVNF
jgi:hypothetical protein